MKNKDKYKLTELKFKVETYKNNTYRIPVRKWKVYEYDSQGKLINTIVINGGGISDIMAWLESENEVR